jgi:hypothetical protein
MFALWLFRGILIGLKVEHKRGWSGRPDVHTGTTTTTEFHIVIIGMTTFPTNSHKL